MNSLAKPSTLETAVLVLALVPVVAWAIFMAVVEPPRGLYEVNRGAIFALRALLLVSAVGCAASVGSALFGFYRRQVRLIVAFVGLVCAAGFLAWAVPLLVRFPSGWLWVPR